MEINATTITIGLFSLVMLMVIIGFVRNRTGRKKTINSWEKENAENPEQFLADDEIIHVEYKGELIPIRAVDKIFQWDKMSGRERRDYWLGLQQALKKGTIKKVLGENGKPMYVATAKGRLEKRSALAYQKLKKGV